MDEYETRYLAVMERIATALEGGARQAASAARSAPPSSSGGLCFPNYGRAKGTPVAGATKQDLEFYKRGCERTLDDPEKARFHDRERTLLAAINAELGISDAPPPADDGPPPADDAPF